ncbi:MAG: hypothetical protein AB1813_20980 [Verrucomicrobiota bacterium]
MYRHTQVAPWAVIGFVVGVAIIAAVTPTWAALFPIGLVFVCFLLFYKLTVAVDASELQVIYGVGVLKFRFPIAEIAHCQPARNKWWYGWGIRYLGRGNWLYNISGLEAVELTLRNGKKPRIGTDEPEKLTRAISEKLKPQ